MLAILVRLNKSSMGPRLAAAVAAFTLGMLETMVLAQDLESGAQSAAADLKKVIKIGLVTMTVVIVSVGLVLSGLKFMKKEPDAVFYLLGTVAASVLCGIGAGML